jgi:uncharacterized coiled-coil protein SlyX
MSDDQFTKLFKYMEQRFDGMDKRFDAQDKKIADLTGAIAELSAQVRDYHNETIILTHQVDRLREAIKQIAEETGITLKVAL